MSNRVPPVRNSLVRLAAGAVFYSGALRALQLLERRRHKGDGRQGCCPFAVLLYHRVNPDHDPFFPAMSVTAFEAQMRYLAANYRVMALGEIVSRIRQGLEVVPGTIAITFDDGYRDNYLYAHPILRKHNLPATLFAAAGYIGTDELMWNDKVAEAVKLTIEHKVELPGAGPMMIRSTAEKLAALQQILETLKMLPERDKQARIDELLSRLSVSAMKQKPLMLSWTELQSMAHDGWEIGSHTMNHVILTRVPFSEAQEEIRSSRALLQEKLDRPVELFSYPNGKPGDYDGAIQKYLADEGFLGGVTTDDRLNSRKTDLFAIGRKSPWAEPVAAFASKLHLSHWRRGNGKGREQSAESMGHRA